MPVLGIFGLDFENNIVIREINALRFVKNKFLIHTMNFVLGSTFLKVCHRLFVNFRLQLLAAFIKYALLLHGNKFSYSESA